MSENVDALLLLASESYLPFMDAEEILERVAVPRFLDAGKVHDWRNYIPEGIQTLWSRLPDEARIIAYMLAHEWAMDEEWD